MVRASLSVACVPRDGVHANARSPHTHTHTHIVYWASVGSFGRAAMRVSNAYNRIRLIYLAANCEHIDRLYGRGTSRATRCFMLSILCSMRAITRQNDVDEGNTCNQCRDAHSHTGTQPDRWARMSECCSWRT